MLKKTLVREWGIKPWEFDKLTVRDIQDIRLAEHAETYIEQEQRRGKQNPGSISEREYNSQQSRHNAFN